MIYELLPFMDIGNHAFFTVPAGARNRQIWSWIETNSIFTFRVDDNQLDIQPAMQRTLIRFGLLFRMLWQRRKKGVLIYMAVLWGRLSLFFSGIRICGLIFTRMLIVVFISFRVLHLSIRQLSSLLHHDPITVFTMLSFEITILTGYIAFMSQSNLSDILINTYFHNNFFLAFFTLF